MKGVSFRCVVQPRPFSAGLWGSQHECAQFAIRSAYAWHPHTQTRPTSRGKASPTLAQLLAAAVERHPSALAVTCEGVHLTYGEMDELSSQIARVLIERGVGPEDRVAVSVPRSIESVLAVWAIAKAGAAFVPMDPSYPSERISYMLDDSRPVIGVTVGAQRGHLPDGVECSSWTAPSL